MAISYLNSQGTVIYLISAALADTVDQVTPADDLLVILAGDAVICPQSIGSLEETRTVTEYKCMSSDDSAKALGSISRGNIELGLLFDPDDADGQAVLKAAFADNLRLGIGIELPDRDDALGETLMSGTVFYFEGSVSAISVGIEQDAAVTYTVTVEISSDVVEYAAVAGSA